MFANGTSSVFFLFRMVWNFGSGRFAHYLKWNWRYFVQIISDIDSIVETDIISRRYDVRKPMKYQRYRVHFNFGHNIQVKIGVLSKSKVYYLEKKYLNVSLWYPMFRDDSDLLFFHESYLNTNIILSYWTELQGLISITSLMNMSCPFTH